nr:hypothetical protein BaRGS_023245 [Batillaria attramentaria]
MADAELDQDEQLQAGLPAETGTPLNEEEMSGSRGTEASGERPGTVDKDILSEFGLNDDFDENAVGSTE